MSRCVLDSSSALAFVLPGEADEDSRRLMNEVAREGAVVPAIWPIEVANTLVVAERRGRMSSADRREAFVRLSTVLVQVELRTIAHTWSDAVGLAESHGLTVYDARYLEAAMRLALPLASRDEDLRKAARSCGVELLR